MSNRWKQAIERVDTLDEARREQIAQVVLDMIDGEESARLRGLLAEAEADIAAGRTEPGSAGYWDRQRAEMQKLTAAKA
jgi:hypothetical protein